MRVCFCSLSGYTVRTVVDGSMKKHRLEGPGAGGLQDILDIFDRSFKNVSFSFLEGCHECEEMMMKNLSDASTNLAVQGFRGLEVPVPMFGDKTAIMSGYNVTRVDEKNVASALANFTLFKPEVYICSLALVSMFILLVTGRILIHRHHRREMARILLKTRNVRVRLPPERPLRHAVYNHVKRIFAATNDRFKFISLLLAILIFSLTAFFYGLYCTSKVVFAVPEIVKSYGELLAHATANPIFLDGIISRSQEFRDAPRGSLQSKVWEKFMQLDVNSRHIWKELYDGSVLKEAIKTSISEMFANKSVVIQASITAEVFQTFFCCSSPETELWRFVLNHDQNEPEELVGFPVSPFIKDKGFFANQLRFVSEMGMLVNVRRDKETVKGLASLVAGTAGNTAHIRDQMVVCDDDFQHDAVNEVNSLPRKYYNLFFLLIFCFLALAFIVLLLEILAPPVKGLGKRRYQRMRIAPLPPVGHNAGATMSTDNWRIDIRAD